MIIRRLALIASIAFCGSLALAAGASAAKGGGLGPGDYTFTSTTANAFFGGGKGLTPQPSFSIFVSRGLNSFQPEKHDGGATVMESTMVQYTEFDATGVGGFSCFIIPDKDFSAAKNLQSASLHTTLTVDNMCPGVGKPVAAGKDVAPLKGSGGGLNLPIKVDVTWSGVGVTTTLRDRFSFTCLRHVENGTNNSRDSIGGSASGTTSSLIGPFTTLSADVSHQDSHLEVIGNAQPPCF